MNNKIIVNGVELSNLGNIDTPKRHYAFGKNGSTKKLLEQSRDVWEYAKEDVSLLGNEGSSLTALNERALLFHVLKEVEKLSDKETSDILVNLQELINSIEAKEKLKGNISSLNNYDKYIEELLSFFDKKLGIGNKPFEVIDEVGSTSAFDIVEEPEDAFDKSVLINARDFYSEISKAVPVTESIDTSAPIITAPVMDTVEPVTTNNITDFEQYKQENEPKPSELIDGLSTNELEVLKNISDFQDNKVEDVAPVEEEKALEKAKVKTFLPIKSLRKTGYVDTVILCLVAQLAIFGLLIFVLLLIK